MNVLGIMGTGFGAIILGLIFAAIGTLITAGVIVLIVVTTVKRRRAAAAKAAAQVTPADSEEK